MDTGGLGTGRGDRPTQTLVQLGNGVRFRDRAEVGGAEPGDGSHRPGRGRPRGELTTERKLGADRGGRACVRASLGQARGQTPEPGPSLSPRPSSPSTRTRSADRRSWVKVTLWERKSGGG